MTNLTESAFGSFVRSAVADDILVVQPRMGFGEVAQMRLGLMATQRAGKYTVGTITIDSFTRTGDTDSARHALAHGSHLNGYPISVYSPDATRKMLEEISGNEFPVQVRHGSAAPAEIFASMIAAGLHATEGGPVSYCLPYSRTPLSEAISNWRRACELLAAAPNLPSAPHIESFGGCMLGQLCPPELLVALSVLEGMFFVQHGVRSISMSYAQQTSADQDVEALQALRSLAGEFLAAVDWHVVFYAYMGVFPKTRLGAKALLAEAAVIARCGGAHRLITKTAVEAHRIPTIEENVQSLRLAAVAARNVPRAPFTGRFGVYRSARALIQAVLDLDSDVGCALLQAFKLGYLDIPYCLHPDNAGRARSYIDQFGILQWVDTGSLPLPPVRAILGGSRLSSTELLQALNYMQDKFDSLPVEGGIDVT